MSLPGLTVAMIVRDEAENLQALLPGLVDTADDVIVVDTGSRDETVAIARNLGARVFEQEWAHDFAEARNRSLEEVGTSHVLWLDADDRIESDDILRIRQEALALGDVGLMLLLVNESPDPSNVSSCWQLRVFPARPEHRFLGRIHEQVQPALEATGTRVEQLDVTIRHLGYIDGAEVIRKSRRNLELLRREMAAGRGEDITVLFHFVKAASRCGELEAASEVARRCIADPPEGTPKEVVQSLAVTLAHLEDQRGQRDEAIRVLDEAIERVPDDPMARFFRADIRRRAGDLAGALTDLEVARAAPIRAATLPVPIAGLSRAIRLTMGEIQEVLGRPAEAAATYREILDRMPEDRSARRALARALVGACAYDQAETVLNELDDQPDDRGELLLLRATLAYHRGDDENARASYESALEMMPRAWAAHLHLGHLALRRLDFEAAEKHYQNALEVSDNPETRVGRAAFHLEANRLADCLDDLASVVENCASRPLPPGTEALSGEALYRFGRWNESLGAFEKHLRRFGPDARIVSRIADCYRELEVPEAARLGYTEALNLDPSLDEARRGLEALGTVH